MSNGESNKSIVIADDHAIVRNGLVEVFQKIPNVSIVGQASNGVEAISLGKSLQPDLLTLDAGMPLSNGMEVYGEVRLWSPKTKIAVITGFTAIGGLTNWLAAGVDGLFLKTCTPEELRTGLTFILNGSEYVQEDITDSLRNQPQGDDLTQRERQILHLVANGYSNAEIGDRLSISAKTVDNHRSRLMAKLGVHSIAQLVAHALKEGLLENALQSANATNDSAMKN